MFELLYEKIADPRTLLAVLIGVFTIASLISIGLPYLEGDDLDLRMKSVASERERIRARERDKLVAKNASSGNLRQTHNARMKNIVERFSLSKWLGTEAAKEQLAQAGFRGPQAEIGFLFFRLVTPIGCLFFGTVYIFFVLDMNSSFMMKICELLLLVLLGL